MNLAEKASPVDDIRAIGQVNASPAKIITTLHELRKHDGGLVSFTESIANSSGGAHHQSIKRIEITQKGRIALARARQILDSSMTQIPSNVLSNATRTAIVDGFISDQHASDLSPRHLVPFEEEAVASADLSAVEVVSTRKPDAPEWPELDRLRAKEAASRDAHRRAEAYLTAATTLEDIDIAESQRLSDLAEAAVADSKLSRVESEYLAFAKARE